MTKRIHFTPKQAAKIYHWLDANYAWAKENFLDKGAWIDINANIITEREGIEMVLFSLLNHDPDWRKEVFGSEKELGKLVPNVVIYD